MTVQLLLAMHRQGVRDAAASYNAARARFDATIVSYREVVAAIRVDVEKRDEALEAWEQLRDQRRAAARSLKAPGWIGPWWAEPAYALLVAYTILVARHYEVLGRQGWLLYVLGFGPWIVVRALRTARAVRLAKAHAAASAALDAQGAIVDARIATVEHGLGRVRASWQQVESAHQALVDAIGQILAANGGTGGSVS